jgi:hypothetical protein
MKVQTMRLKIILFIFHLSFFLFHWAACKEKTTAPPDNMPDTTSHDFTWRIDTLGTYGSVLYDVAVISEDDIWAVGEIHTNETDRFDSLGNWVNPYNAAHWNGGEWELKRIPYIYNGQPFYHSLNFALSFESGEVWFGGNGIVQWNGNRFSNVEIGPNAWGAVAINKMWGHTVNEVYIVGNEGAIAYYNGNAWQKLESGTTTNITDVWGNYNEKTKKTTVLATVSDRYSSGEYRLLSLSANGVRDTLDWNLSRRLNSVWFDENSPVYECGSGLRVHSDTGWVEIDISPWFTTRVRGIATNDIFVTGAFGLLMHYNGSTWLQYPEMVHYDGSLEGLSYKGNTMAAAGYTGNKALIITGYRP